MPFLLNYNRFLLPPLRCSPVDSLNVRTKILALELLQSILETSGASFRRNERFTRTAIKKLLMRSLLPNGVSMVPRVFQLPLRIFWILMVHFKDHLKSEIGIFFNAFHNITLLLT